MLEKDLQTYIIKHLNKLVPITETPTADAPRPFVTKVMQASPNGTPDILVCYKGWFVAIEVKRPNVKPRVSALQNMALNRIRHAGGVAVVINSIEQADNFIEALKTLPPAPAIPPALRPPLP